MKKNGKKVNNKRRREILHDSTWNKIKKVCEERGEVEWEEEEREVRENNMRAR